MMAEITKVFAVEGEHPFGDYYPNELFATYAGAIAKAVELTRMLLADYWAIANEDTPLLAVPEVSTDNWVELVEEYGDDDDFVQEGGWGRWWVEITEKEVQP
jgi:hypothetical protein